ncbi:DUF2934 domain-containing protein [Paraburkholderia sp.]|uniref:DUF2934 domain-containing protein n=1 Tax=Paraburkholderia sp. TaxID=1926495 RepID=UPI0023948FF2|nr:DUF2934 domain-containing protein [Paraburkholderia sp.]MDE1181711.1 DUF2934 domain-containing protein [Paraburkholderia sp.]
MAKMSIDEQIRTRAYYLWQNAKHPKTSPDDYWEQARLEIEGEGVGGEANAEADALSKRIDPPPKE